jgi:hypothetical protein
MTVTSVDSTSHRATRAPYRMSIETAGLFTLLLGAWAGIVSYIGPIFGFSGDGAGSWTWDLAHGLLFLAPGAAACLTGLLIMIEGLSTSRARRALLAMGGLVTIACGAWLVVGTLAWRALEGPAFFLGASPLRELEYWIGYSLGPGGLLLALGSFVLGRSRVGSAAIDPMAETVPIQEQ